MSSFPKIESLGLNVYPVFNGDGPDRFSVDADDLEALLEKGQKLYSFQNTPYKSDWASMDSFPNKNPDHEGLLIGIREIEKEAVKDVEPVDIEQFSKAVNDFLDGLEKYPEIAETVKLINRIRKELGSK